VPEGLAPPEPETREGPEPRLETEAPEFRPEPEEDRTEGPRREGARENAEFRETEASDPDLVRTPNEAPLGRIRDVNARDVPEVFRFPEAPWSVESDFDPDFGSNDLRPRVVIREFPRTGERVGVESRRTRTLDKVPLRPDRSDPAPRGG